MKRTALNLRTPLDYVDRRWERIYHSFETRMSTYTRFFLPVRVINFSGGGFLLGVDHHLTKGDAVMIELAGVGEATGRITWVFNGRAGGCFDRPIDVRAMMQALESQEQCVEPAAMAR